ncbi:uncharacterized protein C8R40DRAFT_410539 [Lentinula edodes]|uniref:uncharacterized protein n=1 Tax=Lentinula edodes TaxID=5353 RepID=UPI001E8DD592|nr:uncharacterized protein C8R40DRAFT_410539 [Lentinula edodes]KAH7872971.1 hypothetical protein C8R40DRAFT_410539 [Lentinula edodes]
MTPFNYLDCFASSAMVKVPFDHLFTSNYPAEDSEITDIQTALLESRNRLRLLEGKLNELEIENDLHPLDERANERYDSRAQLLLCRDQQRAHITKLQSTLSSFRRLPPEILLLIFSFALPSWWKGVSMDPSSVIWRISQVCGLWRAIVCESMPYLWSSIEIDCVGAHEQNLTNTLLELALQRSGSRPLSIRFYFSRKDMSGVLPESEKRCLKLLASQSFRWEAVELQYIPIAALDSLSATVKHRIPLLRWLVVANIPVSHAADTPSTAEAFQVAPQLRHFSLSGFFRPSRFYLPWLQLSSYTGSFRDFRDFLFVLEYAKNLNTCDVFLRNFHPGSRVDHLNMQTMHLRGQLVGLSRLYLPSLQTLVLDELLLQDLSPVSTFLRRTPSVASLEVYIFDTGAENSISLLSEVMHACTNINSLVLMGEYDIRSVCSLLDISETPSQGRILMPRLRHLSLSVLATADTEVANILGLMLESRRYSTLHDTDHECVLLSSLTLYSLREPSVILQRLKPIEETLGLSVLVKTV